jgi:hypothetical protein
MQTFELVQSFTDIAQKVHRIEDLKPRRLMLSLSSVTTTSPSCIIST